MNDPFKMRTFCLLLVALSTAIWGQAPRPRTISDEQRLKDAISAVERASQPSTKVPPAAVSSAVPTETRQSPPAVPKPRPGPQPAEEKKKGEGKAAPTKTVITGDDPSEYRNKENLGIFRKNVVLDRPDLKIWCDQLDATMNQPAAAKPQSKTVAAVRKNGQANDDGVSPNDLKLAIARGKENPVVIWRKTDQGEVISTCREAHYEGANGTITLKGKPEVLRQLRVNLIGKDDRSEIVLLKSGDCTGRFDTNLFADEQEARAVRTRLLKQIPKRHREGVPNAPPALESPDSGAEQNAKEQ